jgi:hypothetical protein
MGLVENTNKKQLAVRIYHQTKNGQHRKWIRQY